MNERLACPVVDKKLEAMGSLSRFRQRTSQALIYSPYLASKIIENAEEKIRGYYAAVIAANLF